MNSEKGFGSFGAFSSLSASSSTPGGFSFKPSALAPLTTHINTKVISNPNSDLPENSHTPEVLKFLSSKPEDLLADSERGGKSASQEADSKPSFVFGKNINARVINIVHSPPHDTEATEAIERSPTVDASKPSETVDEGKKSPLESEEDAKGSIFLTASKGLIKAPSEPSSASQNIESGSSVGATAAEKSVFQTPENAFNINRLPPPVASLETGEENEDTLFHATCKLHVFDSQKNTWLERGRGLVKINRDRTTQKCRIVMRQQGIFRLLLNSPIFAGMRLKQVSARGIHVTAAEVETGAMRVFLLTSTTPTEALHLFHYLTRLVADVNAAEAEEKTQHNHEEWHAAEGTRSSKHGRQTGSDNSVRNSREDINKIAPSSSSLQKQDEQQAQQRAISGAVRRGSAAGNFAQHSDESDEDEDSGHDRKAKRALTVLPRPKGGNEDSNNSNSNSRGSLEDGSEEGSVGDDEEEVEEEEGSGLDDSLSSNSATGGPSNSGKPDPDPVSYSADTSNASLDLKRPRLLTTNVDGVSEEDNKAENE